MHYVKTFHFFSFQDGATESVKYDRIAQPSEGEDVLMCSLSTCSFSSPDVSQFLFHFIVKHTHIKPYRCPHCSFVSALRSLTQYHIRKDHAPLHKTRRSREFIDMAEIRDMNMLLVNFARGHFTMEERLLYETRMTADLKNHVDSTTKQLYKNVKMIYKCKKCCTWFNERHEIEKHVKVSHINIKPWQCCHCSYVSPLASMVKDHHACLAGQDQTNIFVVNDLRKTLRTNMTRYVQAMYTAHVVGTDKILTPEGSSVVASHAVFKGQSLALGELINDQIVSIDGMSRYEEFLSTVWQDDRKFACSFISRYSCKKCGFEHTDRKRVQNHVLKKHINMYPYGCAECDFVCASINNMKTHMSIHHRQNKAEVCVSFEYLQKMFASCEALIQEDLNFCDIFKWSANTLNCGFHGNQLEFKHRLWTYDDNDEPTTGEDDKETTEEGDDSSNSPQHSDHTYSLNGSQSGGAHNSVISDNLNSNVRACSNKGSATDAMYSQMQRSLTEKPSGSNKCPLMRKVCDYSCIDAVAKGKSLLRGRASVKKRRSKIKRSDARGLRKYAHIQNVNVQRNQVNSLNMRNINSKSTASCEKMLNQDSSEDSVADSDFSLLICKPSISDDSSGLVNPSVARDNQGHMSAKVTTDLTFRNRSTSSNEVSDIVKGVQPAEEGTLLEATSPDTNSRVVIDEAIRNDKSSKPAFVHPKQKSNRHPLILKLMKPDVRNSFDDASPTSKHLVTDKGNVIATSIERRCKERKMHSSHIESIENDDSELIHKESPSRSSTPLKSIIESSASAVPRDGENNAKCVDDSLLLIPGNDSVTEDKSPYKITVTESSPKASLTNSNIRDDGAMSYLPTVSLRSHANISKDANHNNKLENDNDMELSSPEAELKTSILEGNEERSKNRTASGNTKSPINDSSQSSKSPNRTTSNYTKSPVNARAQSSKSPIRTTSNSLKSLNITASKSSKSPIQTGSKSSKSPIRITSLDNSSKSGNNTSAKTSKSPIRTTSNNTKSPVNASSQSSKSPIRTISNSSQSLNDIGSKSSKSPIKTGSISSKSPIRAVSNVTESSASAVPRDGEKDVKCVDDPLLLITGNDCVTEDKSPYKVTVPKTSSKVSLVNKNDMELSSPEAGLRNSRKTTILEGNEDRSQDRTASGNTKSPINTSSQSSTSPNRTTSNNTKSHLNASSQSSKSAMSTMSNSLKSLNNIGSKSSKSPIKAVSKSSKSPIRITSLDNSSKSGNNTSAMTSKSPIRTTSNNTKSPVNASSQSSKSPIRTMSNSSQSLNDIGSKSSKSPIKTGSKSSKSPIRITSKPGNNTSLKSSKSPIGATSNVTETTPNAVPVGGEMDTKCIDDSLLLITGNDCVTEDKSPYKVTVTKSSPKVSLRQSNISNDRAMSYQPTVSLRRYANISKDAKFDNKLGNENDMELPSPEIGLRNSRKNNVLEGNEGRSQNGTTSNDTKSPINDSSQNSKSPIRTTSNCPKSLNGVGSKSSKSPIKTVSKSSKSPIQITALDNSSKSGSNTSLKSSESPIRTTSENTKSPIIASSQSSKSSIRATSNSPKSLNITGSKSSKSPIKTGSKSSKFPIRTSSKSPLRTRLRSSTSPMKTASDSTESPSRNDSSPSHKQYSLRRCSDGPIKSTPEAIVSNIFEKFSQSHDEKTAIHSDSNIELDITDTNNMAEKCVNKLKISVDPMCHSVHKPLSESNPVKTCPVSAVIPLEGAVEPNNAGKTLTSSRSPLRWNISALNLIEDKYEKIKRRQRKTLIHPRKKLKGQIQDSKHRDSLEVKTSQTEQNNTSFILGLPSDEKNQGYISKRKMFSQNEGSTKRQRVLTDDAEAASNISDATTPADRTNKHSDSQIEHISELIRMISCKVILDRQNYFDTWYKV